MKTEESLTTKEKALLDKKFYKPNATKVFDDFSKGIIQNALSYHIRDSRHCPGCPRQK